MDIEIYYFYNNQYIGEGQWVERHNCILAVLQHLQKVTRVCRCVVREHKEAFPTKENERKFLNELSEFSLRHHVALAQIFGSRKHGFSYLPPQFLPVYSAGRLVEVFPCRVGDTEIGLLDFLGRLKRGEAWNTISYRAGKKTKHEELIGRILSNSNNLEIGLTLHGKNVHVSQNFGELGFIDLIFTDKNNRYLLVEVKVKPGEIDKAIGQILKYRELFARQNFVEKERVRVGIACPFIPPQAKVICEGAGIESFELEKSK
jgi:hypothetical protein